MSSTAKKISELSEITAVTGDDYVVIVNDPAGTPSTKKVSVKNLFGNSTANVAITALYPSNSTMTAVRAGSVFYDTNYIYVAVADNLVKRVALSLF